MSEIEGYFEVDYPRFAAFVHSLRAVLAECRLHIRNDRIYVIGVDTANVAMVSASLSIDKFDGKEVEIGLDVYKIGSCLDAIEKRYSPEDTHLKISWCPGKDRPLFNIECSTMFRFQFDTIDVNTIRKDPNDPVIKLPAKFTCDGDLLSWAFTAGGICSDKCRFDASGEDRICYVAAKCDTPDQCRIPLGENVTAPACAMFSLDYLKDIGKFWRGCPEVAVALADDHPIEFTGERLPGLFVKFLLAPRIETEDPVTGWLE